MEWIYPLKEVANTGNTYLFFIFVALSFALYLFNAPFIAVFVSKIAFILFALHHIFFDDPIFSIEWISIIFSDVFKNIGLLFERSWDKLTNEFRTLLFFVLLWLISYLIKYWLQIKRNILLFFVMTIIYITVLDTFTPYNSKLAILRTTIIGFILIGMLFFQRFMQKENLQSTRKLMTKWMIPLIVMIAVSTIFALIAPKASPIWPDPVPFLKSHAGGENNKDGKGKGISRVGYRKDDSQLGGPFVGDDTIVFTARAESRQYWRMETKDLYTGKGWKSSKPPATSTYKLRDKLPITLNEDLESFWKEGNGDNRQQRKTKMAAINVMDASAKLVHTYDFTNIMYEPPSGIEDKKYALLVNHVTEQITAIKNNEPFYIRDYFIYYQPQQYSVKQLSETTGENDQVDPQYTQLPENFPKRVKDLAKELTKDKTNWYDKTRAIEEYLQSGRYRYDQTDVAIPKEKQDYVDQFLFETLKGYCDNFSTSMVTMLRSIGIPARWVKGYSSGVYQGSEDVSVNIYKVTNNNAHSWVEVFFPNVGWVPFEPTMGFVNNSIFNNDLDRTSTQTATTEEKTEKNPIKKPQKDSALDKETKQSEGFSFSDLLDKIKNYFKTHWVMITFIFIAFIAILSFMYVKRSKWIPFILIWKYRMKKDSNTFSQAYLSLLKQLGRFGLKKETGQTLREYANNVDEFFKTKTMRTLTEHYEKQVYRNQNKAVDWEEIRELWENLIKKTTG
ncbi:transglutaminase TgpA family protein [Heyndrickxia sporothermodurans]